MIVLRLAVVAMLLVSAAGCGGTSSPSSPTPVSPTPVATPPSVPAAASSSVTIPIGAASLGNRAYRPDEITVAVGDTITWVNADSVAHTSTANDGRWESGTLAPGQEFSTTLRTPGTFAYHCAIHPGMVGTVVVR
jgi:plastocyanin